MSSNEHDLILKAREFVQDKDTVILVKHGLRETFPGLNLLHDDCVTYPEEYHSCSNFSILRDNTGLSNHPPTKPSDKSPGYDGGNDGCDNNLWPHQQWADDMWDPDWRIEKKTGQDESVETCVSCDKQGRQTAMHRVECGHFLCRFCIQQKAMCSMSRDHLDDLILETAQRIYDPTAKGYARNFKEKHKAIMALWDRMGWGCCSYAIPFRDFLSPDPCIPLANAETLQRVWSTMVRRLDGFGRNFAMFFLEGYMVLEIDNDDEIVRCNYPGLEDFYITHPFRRTVQYPEGLMGELPRLASQSRALRSLAGLPAIPAMFTSLEERNASSDDPVDTPTDSEGSDSPVDTPTGSESSG